jgi:hypothetical protein
MLGVLVACDLLSILLWIRKDEIRVIPDCFRQTNILARKAKSLGPKPFSPAGSAVQRDQHDPCLAPVNFWAAFSAKGGYKKAEPDFYYAKTLSSRGCDCSDGPSDSEGR